MNSNEFVLVFIESSTRGYTFLVCMHTNRIHGSEETTAEFQQLFLIILVPL
jgi:hypothetical protein